MQSDSTAKRKTLVLGATDNPGRYAFLAINRLVEQGHPVIAVGKRDGTVAGISIQKEFPSGSEDIHTITMYLNAANQRMYHDRILALHPKRIIFNPGSENPILKNLALAEGIAVEEACTLVMLTTGAF
ncbi:MAG TPA: CoA-binding protein [Anseongella sp.]